MKHYLREVYDVFIMCDNNVAMLQYDYVFSLGEKTGLKFISMTHAEGIIINII